MDMTVSLESVCHEPRARHAVNRSEVAGPGNARTHPVRGRWPTFLVALTAWGYAPSEVEALLTAE